ncbi:OmpA family protein [Rhodospirillum centenum]|uniref:OmpA family protein n=1 Tax=Rhodospirillum centenum (strain ATCC 51521 / SW) TaxID=414684 RepID=B6IPM6_RHOCS|nr:OmpA family protein [Rhodospirillum centenum]ACI99728.1 OmpA family protein [Rhodospirillum centenum SW]
MAMVTGPDEETEEGYFASISDLMIGILFIFLLMLTVFALNFRNAEEKVVDLSRYEEVVNEARRLTEEAAKQKQENEELRRLLTQAVAQLERDIESRRSMRNQMLQSLEASLDRQGVRVTLDPESGILRLSGDLLFETGKAVYREEADRTVKVMADILGSVLPCFAEGASVACPGERMPILEAVLVEGHTDRQPFRNVPPAQSQALNDRLSTERALAVFQSLRETSPVLETLRNPSGQPLLGVSGYGERRPLPEAQGTTEEDYRRNRRIDLRFVLSSRTSDELERLRGRIHDVLGPDQEGQGQDHQGQDHQGKTP